MGSSKKVCLWWNDFHNNTISSFSHMRKDQEFCDVTLACDGDHKVEAHKVVLAASSSFFSKLLKQNNHPHPLIYMRGMNTLQMTSVVDFIYRGEVNIHQDDLDDFLKLAGELDLQGLNGPEKSKECKQYREQESSNSEHIPSNPVHNEVTKFPDSNILQTDENSFEETSLVLADLYSLNDSDKSKEDLQTKVYRVRTNIKDTPTYFPSRNPSNEVTQSSDSQSDENCFEETSLIQADVNSVKTNSTYENLDDTINSMIRRQKAVGKRQKATDGKANYICLECGKETRRKCDMRHHIEGKHIEGVSHPCNKCQKYFRSRNSLSNHKSIRHN